MLLAEMLYSTFDLDLLSLCHSVLETEKSLVLAEKGSGEDDDVELITAGPSFRLLATMNPGGDFGKKEVSVPVEHCFCAACLARVVFLLKKPRVPFGSAGPKRVTDPWLIVCPQLSPALRNRFTEIWCPQSNGRSDLLQIIQHNLRPGLSLDHQDHQGLYLHILA